MPNYYGQPTRKELHFQSLQAAEILAKQAREVAIANDWDYEKAIEYVRSKHHDLCELELKGYVDEQESRSYAYTSHEASTLISDGAKEIMKQDKCSYVEATDKFYADPANAEIIRSYAQAD
jgi:hypothetical protein